MNKKILIIALWFLCSYRAYSQVEYAYMVYVSTNKTWTHSAFCHMEEIDKVYLGYDNGNYGIGWNGLPNNYISNIGDWTTSTMQGNQLFKVTTADMFAVHWYDVNDHDGRWHRFGFNYLSIPRTDTVYFYYHNDPGPSCTNYTELTLNIYVYDPVFITKVQTKSPDGTFDSNPLQCAQDGMSLVFDMSVKMNYRSVIIQSLYIDGDTTILANQDLGTYDGEYNSSTNRYTLQKEVSLTSLVPPSYYGKPVCFRAITTALYDIPLRGNVIPAFTFVPRFPDPTVSPVPPSCHGSTDAGADVQFTPNNYTFYAFSISKLVPKTGSTCDDTYGSGGSGIGIPNDQNYCFTGEAASVYVPDIANGHIIINDGVLDPPDKSGFSGLHGNFGAGDYEVSVEAKDPSCLSCPSCPKYFILHIPDVPEFSMGGAAPTNHYEWNGETYNIQAYGATDYVSISLSGGNAPYSYIVDGKAISNGNTSFSYPGVGAGTYTVSVGDAHGCPVSGSNKSVQMRQPDPFKIDTLILDTVSCHIGNIGTHNDGKINLLVKGGIGPFSVTSLPSVGTTFVNQYNAMILPGFSATGYSITIRDKYISHKDTTLTFVSRPQMWLNPISESDKTWPPCIGGADGTIKVSGYGGSPFTKHGMYKFFAESKTDTIQADTAVIPNLEATIYNIYIQDQYGCRDTIRNVKIPQNPDPLRLALTDTMAPLCHDFSDGSASFAGYSGFPYTNGFNFELSDVNTHDRYNLTGFTVNFDGIKSGTYQVIIQDTKECVINDAYRDTFYLSHPDPIGVKTTMSHVTRKSGNNGILKASFSGGHKKYRFEWYRGPEILDENIISRGITMDTTSVFGLTEGEYMLRVQDTCGCGNGTDIDVPAWFTLGPMSVKGPPSALGFNIMERVNASCYGFSDGRIVVDGFGGWGSVYQYGLTPGQLGYNGVFENLPAGLYTVYVKDEENELYSDTIRITEPVSLSASIASTTPARCYGIKDGGFALDINGGTIPYYISVDDNVSKIVGISMSGLGAGLYNVLISDSNHCSVNVPVTITQPDSVSITLENLVHTSCREASGSLSVLCSGGISPYTYQWFDNNNQVVGNAGSVEKLQAGTYRLSVTDQNNCNKLSPWYTILNSDGPLFADTLITPVSCYGYADGKASVTITNGLPPYTFKWSDGQSSASAQGLSSKNYLVTVTDMNDCNNYAALFIPTPDSLSINTVSVADPQCYGYKNGSITVTGLGGTAPYQYTWDNGNSGATISGLGSGIHHVTLTDAHQCTSQSSFKLNDPSQVVLNLDNVTTICGGQSVTFDAGEFVAYKWSSDNGFSSASRAVQLSNQGNYYLEVIDNRGCTGKQTIKINTSNSLLNADFLIKSEANAGDTVVAIDISWPLPDAIHWVYDANFVQGISENYYERLIFNKPGTYLITLYAQLGDCKDNYTHEIIINPRDQLKDMDLGADPLIQKYIALPNPNKGNFKVEVELRESNDIALRLFNNFSLMDQKIIRGMSNYLVEYNIFHLPAGVYILELIAGREREQLKIIIF